MAGKDRSDINMSGIPVAGVGGLGLLAVALVMTAYYPQAWWLMVIGTIGGVALAAALVLYRRHRHAAGPSGDDPHILFRADAAADATHPRAAAVTRPDLEELVAAG